MKHICEWCPLRAKYDNAPKSLVGRFWRWHIEFCPGWKKYYVKLSDKDKQIIQEKYNFKG